MSNALVHPDERVFLKDLTLGAIEAREHGRRRRRRRRHGRPLRTRSRARRGDGSRWRCYPEETHP
jgi:hypothetical protein